MRLLSEGKQRAFDELYERYAKKVHYFFWKMLGNDAEKADDFVQDLFLKLIEKPHLFQEEKKFSTWLYAVAGNMCKNEYRKTAVRNEIKDYAGLEDVSVEDHSNPAFECFDRESRDAYSQFGSGFPQRLHDVAGFRDAAVGQDGDFFLLRRAGTNVKRRHLRNTDPGHDSRRAD